MKFNTVKTTLAASAIGLAALLGTVEINAQSRDRGNNFPPVSNQRNDQQRIEIEKQRQRDGDANAKSKWSRQKRLGKKCPLQSLSKRQGFHYGRTRIGNT